jgi:carboxyl-terminal processing protease
MQDDNATSVTSIIPGGAADKDGRLKPKDQVVGVGQGDSGEIVDTVDMKLSDVVAMIRGKRGTKVRLQVIPVGSTEKKVITITRDRIELKDSEARSEIVTAGKKADGSPYKIGVINLPSFYMDMEAAQRGDPTFKSTTRDCKAILDDFKEKGVDAVLVDLRQNGGGSLSEAINMTGLFIDTGPVVQVKGSDGRVQAYSDYDRGMAWDGPLVVMISRHSASASEIFAGAIQDYDRGLVIGDRTTHGKGTVQSLVDLSRRLFQGVPSPPQLGALKVTIQQFYRPSGASTQNRGVEAHVELPALTSYLEIGESDLDFALEFDEVEEASHVKMGMISSEVAGDLAARSKERIAKSEDFKKVARAIQRYTDRKERKTVSLNEKKFLADREDDDKDEDSDEPEPEVKPVPVVDRNFYVEEALNITVDYVDALKRHKVAATQ